MRKIRARRALAMAGLCLGAALAGCGQKGPLYLPGHSKDTPWPLPPSPAPPQPATSGGAAAPAEGAGKAAAAAGDPAADRAADPGRAADTAGATPTPPGQQP